MRTWTLGYRLRRLGCRFGCGPRRLIPFLMRMRGKHVVRVMSAHPVRECTHFRVELELDVWQLASLSVMPRAGQPDHQYDCPCALCETPRHQRG